MLYGIVAQENLTGSSVLPSGQLAALDFVADTYTMNNLTVSLADIINPTSHRSASGLVIFPITSVIGNLLTLFNTLDWTVVVQFVPNSTAFTAGYSIVFIEGSRTSFADLLQCYEGDAAAGFYDQNDAATSRFCSDAVNLMVVDVVNKIAFTRTDDGAAVSINGNAAVSTATSLSSVITNTFDLCDASAASLGYIQKMDIYSPKLNSELPGLSAL